jgi:hypothetical protein
VSTSSDRTAAGARESEIRISEYLDLHPDDGGYEHHLEREDDRWAAPWWKGWVIVLTLIILYLLWTGTLYFMEPGIR